VLLGAALAPVALQAREARPFVSDDVASDLARYVALGGKASGGPGDNAVGDWLAGELAKTGYVVERQSFEVPWFDQTTATVTTGELQAEVIPVSIVRPTGATGVRGRLVRVTRIATEPFPNRGPTPSRGPDSSSPRPAVSQRVDVTSGWTFQVPRPFVSASQGPWPSSLRSLPAAAAVIEVCVGAAALAVPCEQVWPPDTHRHRRSTHP